MVAKQGHVQCLLLLLPLLRGVLADEPEQSCEAEVCEDPDGGSLLSLQSALKGRFPSVSCLPAGVKAPTNSRSDGFCRGNQCCPEYSFGFPCPNSEASWRAQKPCQLEAIQLARNSSTYLIPFGQNWANTPPRFHPGTTPQHVLDISKPQMPPFEVLSPQNGSSFMSAFKPSVVQESGYYTNRAYPSIWGDLGEVLQPGFGGLRTYSALKVKATSAEPLTLYRMTTWEEEPTRDRMCNIWWGLESTYTHSFFEVSRNIQTCNVYTAIVQCNVSSENVVLVGQGQDLKADGFKARQCATVDGKPTTSFAKKLAEAGFPEPDSNTLQFVTPACFFKGASCRACPLPTGEALGSVKDIAEHVKHPKDPSRCVTDLLGGSGLSGTQEDESRPLDHR